MSMLIPDLAIVEYGEGWNEHGKFQPLPSRLLSLYFRTMIGPTLRNMSSMKTDSVLEIFCVNRRFLPTRVGRNLELTWNIPIHMNGLSQDGVGMELSILITISTTLT